VRRSRACSSRSPGGGLAAATFVVDLNRAPDGSVRAGPLRELPSAAKEEIRVAVGVVAGRHSIVVRPGALAPARAEPSV
jgi:hypothetical protein